MDNAFQELDYSDISAKHVTGNQNKKFSEIDTKRRGGILKLLISFILFILLIIFIIIAISKSNKVKSLNKDIEKKKKELEEKNIELEQGEKDLNTINEEINEIKENILKEESEIKIIQDKIDEIKEDNNALTDEIENLNKQIEIGESILKQYDGKEVSELMKQVENLDIEIEKLRQTPM